MILSHPHRIQKCKDSAENQNRFLRCLFFQIDEACQESGSLSVLQILQSRVEHFILFKLFLIMAHGHAIKEGL